MQTLERNLNFSYYWKRADGEDIKDTHIEALENDATERFFSMSREGYSSGELSTTILIDDSDGEDGIEYTGWWSLAK